MSTFTRLVGLLLFGGITAAAQNSQEPFTFFREQIGLTEDQISHIARGRVIAKVLPSGSLAEIFMFGAVFVRASPESFAKRALDIDRLRQLPGYLNVGRFRDPPILADLNGFTLEPDDIRNLKTCRPGKCTIQLPAEAIRALQAEVDWSQPDIANEVNGRMQRMALDLLQSYRKDGNRVLQTYHDLDHPFNVDAELRSFLARSDALTSYLPDLRRYLLDYPKTNLANVESVFFWEKVNFGMKPTLRLNHAISYRSEGPRGAADVVVVKQLFASHYFQLALDLSACVPATSPSGDRGFYLISLRGSTQQGFSGLMGSLLRRIVVSKTRTTQEKWLMRIKDALESSR
jgi:hypothetical protein